WHIAEKNNLPIKQVINGHAKINSGPLEGKKTLEAREEIVEWLKKNNLFEKEEEMVQNISVAERSGGTIEPLPKLQWFIAVNKEFTKEDGGKTTLKKLMREAVESGAIKIIPERFEKIYYHWIDNLRDWCISRQILYGHQIPVWYCLLSTCTDKEIMYNPQTNRMVVPRSEKIKPIVSIEKPEGCPRCGVKELHQDPDTLDTWFSSGLWTFSTLGWPDKNSLDLKNYHPTSVLETGYDILFFWVARMILMSEYFLGEVPFKTVYLHGLVRDAKGQKMSKSIGNIVDPIDMIAKYGADATRMSLVIGAPAGSDISLSEDKIKGYKHFGNKLWNIARFILLHTEEMGDESGQPATLTLKDKEYIAEMENLIRDVTEALASYRFHIAGEALYHYVWHTLADKIIEESKAVFAGDDELLKKSRAQTLGTLLRNSLLMLHPFMPFITEELWSIAQKKDSGETGETNKPKLLIIESWPHQS
ncbi:class I tRNA ligase family protein, partial [bacterium]|nr:class I tRNA ligase family protein [bacterium]